MALTDESNMVMPVAPMGGFGGGYGGSGFGGDWGSWIILFLIFGMFNGGWGRGGFGGGYGGGGGDSQLGYDFPWLMTGQQNINTNTNNGFCDAMLNDGITSVRDGISALSTQLCGCCGDMQMSLANGFAGVNQGVANGFSQAEIAANSRQMANMNQAFAGQMAMSQGFNQLGSQFADCCCENRLASADLKYTIATENCADRTAAMQNTRDILESQTRNTQLILDKLCALELDGVKAQLAEAQRANVGLQNQVNMANLAASQTAQTAQIRDGQLAATTALVNELRSCPIPSQPVYGSQPIFTCPNNNNNGCGCGCGCGM